MKAVVRRRWSPEELFAGLSPSAFVCSASEILDRETKLWKDLYTEYDARHLRMEVQSRRILNSEEVTEFFSAWEQDEARHTDGFIKLMELTAQSEKDEIWTRLERREHDFRYVAPYLCDEFTFLVLLAFDEMATCHAYAEDKEFYLSFKNPVMMQWLRQLIADEAVHCANALRVIRLRHGHRIPEMPSILKDLMTPVKDASGYQGTFVLDHFGDEYSSDSLIHCRDSLLEAVARPSAKNVSFDLAIA